MPSANKKTRQKTAFPKFPELTYEIELWQAGYFLVAGIDEAGRGALAGPVAAAAVILPVDTHLCRVLSGVRDSKMMTSRNRELWAKQIKEIASGYGIGFASNTEIDAVGIVPATYLAIRRALEGLPFLPQHLLTDFLSLPDVAIPQTPLVKGDARCLSIAAASVLAKTSRDALLCQMDLEFPGYGFSQHKGYGTRYHLNMLSLFGPSPAHRLSFRWKKEI
ncbi:MAG TPA: ribonuclease HII [Anaerolineales bacterium]|nr:ribonuclease HII [Anaerolineales bacterium]